MPSCSSVTESDPCILEGVQPFLAELQKPASLQIIHDGHANRTAVELFIHEVFQNAYGADIQSFYPTLLSFQSENRQRAAVGYRDGKIQPLFSEQYLTRPANELIVAHTGEQIAREQLVEVGNMALAGPGEARWVIAAVTLFLYEMGYRWVLFTAVRPLFNAFQRLGLNPIHLAEADPGLLPDKGQSWGRYYETRPMVCIGNIESGYRKLHRNLSHSQPLLNALLGDVSRQAAKAGLIPQTLLGGLS